MLFKDPLHQRYDHNYRSHLAMLISNSKKKESEWTHSKGLALHRDDDVLVVDAGAYMYAR